MLPQNFNYHTHTIRCDHAKGSDEDYVLAAIKAGYKTLGFSDHAPLPEGFPFRHRMAYKQFDEYKQSVLDLKEKYKDQIDIKLGIEAEFFPEADSTLDQFFNELDYVLLSIHGIDAAHQFAFAHYNNDEQIKLYGQLACKAMSERNWLYLAHPDYFLREQDDFNETCVEITHKMCEAASKNNTIFEVNLTGMYTPKVNFKQGDYYFYPHRMFWEIVSQYPIKCVYGLDAHKPETLLQSQYYDIIEKEFSDLHLDFIKEPLL